MLDHTRIILVKNALSHSLSACKSLKLQGFILPINTEWCGVIVSNEKDIEKSTKNISKKTKTFAFLYEHVEDYGWYYHLYNEGKPISTLHISHIEDEDDTDNINLPLLKDLALSKSHIERFSQLLQTDYRGEEYYLLDLFKAAFQFQQAEYLSYENLESLESSQLEALQVEFLAPPIQKTSFVDHVRALFEEKLQHMDFILDNGLKAELHVIFQRNLNGFVYRMFFDISERNRLTFRLLTPYRDNQTFQSLRDKHLDMTFVYQNKKEMNELLEKHGYLFIKRANEYINTHPVIIGNVDKLYEQKLNRTLTKYNYKQTNYIPNIIERGGVITYQKAPDYTFLFKHYQGDASIEPMIVFKGKEYFIDQIIEYHRESLNLQLRMGQHIYFSFRTETEFFQTVDKLMNYIEWILQTGVENVVI
ncbi:hypothetical protein [Priestia koreensis]|uniref:hypothetical protein n=1 Tax=Priestia koreensis TaxID=284581 RepID=UPI001F5843C9|nr:hypothetical protein [Priestia koreensis]UNL87478.1 hypothetical protein IE339_24485 [Priestia koreensis]